MEPKRDGVYLHLDPWREALDKLLCNIDGRYRGERSPTEDMGETVPTRKAVGRVLDRPAFALISSPHYNAAAMDGIAVVAEDTYTASETNPVILRARAANRGAATELDGGHAGERTSISSIRGTCVWVDTGDPIPPGYDAVIMTEDVNPLGKGRIASGNEPGISEAPDDGEGAAEAVEIIRPAHPWQHVRLIGEDIVEQEMILPEGHVILPTDVAALLAAGLTEVHVRRKPVVHIIPTGTELAPPGVALAPGEIPEFNSSVLSALVEEWGGVPTTNEALPDDFDAISAAVRGALDNGADIVVVNAGSSAGREDFTPRVIQSVGRLLVRGAAIRPGKPVLLGVSRDGRPVLGLPGYPVSMVLTADLFLKPIIYGFLGRPVPERPRLRAYLTTRIVSSLGIEEFIRMRVGKVGERYVATPLGRGAGVTTGLLKSDGVTVIGALVEGFEEGREVEVQMWRPPEEVEKNAVIIGSHDLSLDVLHDILRRSRDPMGISSAHVGSTGGITAVSKGYAHAAGVHLLDETSGVYNIPYVKRYMPQKKAVLFRLAGRVQGIMVPRGNPKRIEGIADLARPDVTIVNRQRGAGTRILLDYYLKRLGIPPDVVKGYGREEHTHMAVAAAVKGGSADAGLGILAAARALGLDFIPLTVEAYDLLIPEEFFDKPPMSRVVEAALSPEFKKAVERLGGYDLSETGKVERV
ncbi:MAG TPA: molybdopterin biosynthesis protein [Clostridia bacterium]|nr:molybdopterin biosynthesis protein [Clostridia bacterium]